MDKCLQLSVIIPTYNEENHLPRLLRQLWQQLGIELQIIVIDGGSNDGTSEIVSDAFVQRPSQIQWCCTKAHRARQLNLGATLANADYILFLHADTVLQDQPDLLRSALDQVQRENQDRDCAGHFPLLFNETKDQHQFGFYFYAAKTALNRIDVINGDQGFLLPRKLFFQLKGFDESLPYMEDARLANKIIEEKRWITLPGHVYTSARRFLSEGFKNRQILNSFLCNFNNIGLDEFFTQAADAYHLQSNSHQLDMLPFLRLIHRIMKSKGFIKAVGYWYLSGRYIVHNAWQLAFQCDCRRDYAKGITAHCVEPRFLSRYDRFVAPWLLKPPFYAICALLTYCWFYSLFLAYKR